MLRLGVCVRRWVRPAGCCVTVCRPLHTSTPKYNHMKPHYDGPLEDLLFEPSPPAADKTAHTTALDDGKTLHEFLQDDSEIDLKEFFENFGRDQSQPTSTFLKRKKGGSSPLSNLLDELSQLTSHDPGATKAEVGEEDLESKYIFEERETMLNIFNKYLNDDNPQQTAHSTDDLSLNLLNNLGDPQSKTDKINDIIRSYSSDDAAVAAAPAARPKRKLSHDIAIQLVEQTNTALTPTISLIEHELSLAQMFELFELLQRDWQLVRDAEFYLRDSLKPKNAAARQQLVESISTTSQTTPQTPLLNVFTLPAIFNALMRTVAVKFEDPQLALSLFNTLKEDLNFYTICCNQQTYNEVMRLHWVFYGKSNLYSIEMIMLEMINNGFTGDLTTFNLLEKIILDYHNMKMGIELTSERSRVAPIWNAEDDKRVKNLERKLFEMGERLRR